jgi:hypothetical protein
MEYGVGRIVFGRANALLRIIIEQLAGILILLLASGIGHLDLLIRYCEVELAVGVISVEDTRVMMRKNTPCEGCLQIRYYIYMNTSMPPCPKALFHHNTVYPFLQHIETTSAFSTIHTARHQQQAQSP